MSLQCHWTSVEAQAAYRLLRAELCRTQDAEAARLLRARCDWLVIEFTRTPAIRAA